jgi:hypothetical protein
MKRLTVAGRLIITAIILGAIFLGYKYLGGKKALDQIAQDQAQSLKRKPQQVNGRGTGYRKHPSRIRKPLHRKQQHLPTRLPHP